MDDMRIAILDKDGSVLAHMDNSAPLALHYFDDELHEYLQGSAYTFDFSAPADHEDTQFLVEGNKLSFRDSKRSKDYYLNILHVEKNEEEVSVESYGLLFELLNEEAKAYEATTPLSFSQYWELFDGESGVPIGINEVSDKKVQNKWTGTETILSRMYSLADLFEAEIEFVTELDNNYSLKSIKANVYKAHSDTNQGMGRARNDITLYYGKEVTGIRKTSDITDLYTALQVTGKENLSIANLVKTEYDSNGNVEYFTSSGDGAIRAPQSRDRFPSNLSKSEDRYILGYRSYDTEDVEELYKLGLADLKEVCQPKIEYEVDGYFDTNIGDTVNIVDDAYIPTLYLNARVIEQVRSFTDPKNNTTTFGNYKELQSQIDPELLNRVQELIASEKIYSCSILTDNGIVFKNGAGITTLSASIRDANKDVSNTLSITWYKDDEEYGVGKSLTINASDIQTKAVYRFEAVDSNGKFRGECEVTLSNVNDGAAGLQGPPGKDAKQSYTHIAYANSEDGHTDFSVDDSNREYIGMFVDYVQMDSTDPDDYRWSRIRGFDGEEGVPGKPGANGKTPYLHIAYANSADGSSGFSTTDSTNKLYIGQYTDYTAADSTDPAKYAWTRIKGDTGATGAAGKDGADGSDGKGVKSSAVTYQAGSSQTTVPTGSWTTTVPKLTTDKPYLWTRTVITYTDNQTTTSYSVSSTLDGFEIGGRNYFSNRSKIAFDDNNEHTLINYQNKGSFTQFRNLTVPMSYFVGKKVKLSFDCISPNGSTPISVYNENGYPRYLISDTGIISPISTEWVHQELDITVTDRGEDGYSEEESNKIEIYCKNQMGCKVRNVKMEIGNKATDWTPAPEDNTRQVDVEYYLSTSTSSLSGGSWQTVAPQWVNGKYMWSRVKTTYLDGTVRYSEPTCIAGAKGDTGADGEDGQMLYATCATASATVAKVATLAAGTLTLKAGATVAVRFTHANNAASPTLNVGGTGAKAIYTQGVRYAYWAAGATVIFTYDGSYWRVCSEPVYASTATIGNPGGYHVYIDGDSLDIMQGSKKVASFSGNGVMITGNSGDQTFAFDGKSLSVYPNNDFGNLGQVSFTVDGNGIISFERQPKVQNYPIPYFKDYEIALTTKSVLIESNARADLAVTFKKSRTIAPDVVIATPYTSTAGGVECAVKNFTKTGFVANMKNGGASAAYFKVCYLAIWL